MITYSMLAARVHMAFSADDSYVHAGGKMWPIHTNERGLKHITFRLSDGRITFVEQELNLTVPGRVQAKGLGKVIRVLRDGKYSPGGVLDGHWTQNIEVECTARAIDFVTT